MSNVRFTLTHNTITVTPPGEQARVVDTSHPNFSRLKHVLVEWIQRAGPGEAIDEDTASTIVALSSTITAIELETDGLVRVSKDGVFYREMKLDDDDFVVKAISDAWAQGHSAKPIMRFLAKMMEAPGRDLFAKDLFAWMKSCDLPLAEDGDILAKKIVRPDFYDHYSGKVKYAIGEETTMPREKCHFDRRTDCGSGLHWGNRSYNFGNPGDPVLLVKIDPRDVTSVPYGEGKGRSWRVFNVRQIGVHGQQSLDLKSDGIEANLIGHDGRPVAMNLPTEETKEVRRPVIRVDRPKRTGVTQTAQEGRAIELKFTNKDGRTFSASQVKKAVADAGGNQRIAAEALGIPRGTIWGWLQKINSK